MTNGNEVAPVQIRSRALSEFTLFDALNQHGRLGSPDDVVGDITQQDAVESRAAVGPHHDEVDIVLLGVADDVFVGRSVLNGGADVDVLLTGPVFDVGDGLLPRFFERLLYRESLALGDGHRVARVDDVHGVDGGVGLGSQVDSVIDRSLYALASVGRNQDVVVHGSVTP